MGHENFEDMYYNDLDEVPETKVSTGVFEKSTSYPRSFSMSPSQRDAVITGQFHRAVISSAHNGMVIQTMGESVLRIAALNAKLYIKNNIAFYVVKF